MRPVLSASLTLSAAVVLAAAASAQTPAQVPAEPPTRAYVQVSAGAGVLPNRLETSLGTRTQNAGGWAGVAEVGLSKGTRELGVRVEGYRSRFGTDADLRGLLPTGDWADAAQVNAFVVARQSYRLGPVDLAFGSGAGVGYNVSRVQEAGGPAQVRDGQVVSSVETRREAEVLPLFHVEGSLGRTVGRTFVGVGVSTSSTFGDHAAARYGVEVRQRL